MTNQTTNTATLDVSPAVVGSTHKNSLYKNFIKRIADLTLALVLLPAVLPIIFVLYLLVRRDGGNGFFGHTRVGKDGHEFKCWKIRSMHPDATTFLDSYLTQNPKAADEWARTQKLTNDPRVTRFGRFLRRTSLDELPQIWNVIRGDMSLVGPRPVITDELHRYGAQKPTYLSMRPGITGLWQIRGRANGCYVERVRLDARYGQGITWLGDLTLILATGAVLVRPTGR